MPSFNCDIDTKIAHFWFEARTGDGASCEDLKQAEAVLGHPLPEELRLLLIQSDGGTSFFSDHERGDVRCHVQSWYGVAGRAGAGNMIELYTSGRSPAPPGVLLFADSPHQWVGIDYRGGSVDAPVVMGDDDVEGLVKIASSFREFISEIVGENPLE